jgi:hypothetical protein
VVVLVLALLLLVLALGVVDGEQPGPPETAESALIILG